MSRGKRSEISKQTVEITNRGFYESANGRQDISQSVRECLEGTRHYSPEELEQLRRADLVRVFEILATNFEVVNETTLAGITRVLADGNGPVAVLNFASAKILAADSSMEARRRKSHLLGVRHYTPRCCSLENFTMSIAHRHRCCTPTL